MKRLLQEPLLHFLVLGALLFISYSALNHNAAPAPQQIVISQGQLASMLDNFVSVRQRPPTQDEWDGLIQARVKEEVYYREALALGMDKDDIIIRRRLQQKMEFISDDISAQAQPSDAELNAYLQAHGENFKVEPQFSFRQVYLNPEKQGANIAHNAEQFLAQLSQAKDDSAWMTMGDQFVLGHDFTALGAGEVTRQFGEKFITSLSELPTGQWQGPVESAFGIHLVLISERTQSRLAELAEVRDRVRREWDEDQRRLANEKFYQVLLKNYTITIEATEPTASKKKVAKAQ
jgi:hypothetical protein